MIGAEDRLLAFPPREQEEMIARALEVAERIGKTLDAGHPLGARIAADMANAAGVLRGELPLEGIDLSGVIAQVAVARRIVDQA